MNICPPALRSIAFCIVLLALAACAGQQTAAPIEGRGIEPEVPVVRQPPTAPVPAPAPAPGGPLVKALPDSESPSVRAIPLPEAGAAVVPLPPGGGQASARGERAPAITELLAKADRSSAQGMHDAARANLERAVKIAPRDAELWQRMATVSYAQGDWMQAKSLAERSNSFAAPGSALAARNWTLIGNAELKLGNQSAAASAFERAGAFAP